MSEYPRTVKAGIEISPANDQSPPGVSFANLKSNLTRLGLWEAWTRWGAGITCGANGVYPWDVESFLSGQPNWD